MLTEVKMSLSNKNIFSLISEFHSFVQRCACVCVCDVVCSACVCVSQCSFLDVYEDHYLTANKLHVHICMENVKCTYAGSCHVHYFQFVTYVVFICCLHCCQLLHRSFLIVAYIVCNDHIYRF